MKKLLVIISILIWVNHVKAENLGVGIVNKVDLESGYIIIDMTRYKIGKGITEVLSGDHKIGFDRLKLGTKIDFITDDLFVTKIRLKTPLKFNY